MFGTMGYGGQMGFGDMKHQLGFAFLTNYLGYHLIEDPRYVVLKEAMYQVVRDIKAQRDK